MIFNLKKTKSDQKNIFHNESKEKQGEFTEHSINEKLQTNNLINNEIKDAGLKSVE